MGSFKKLIIPAALLLVFLAGTVILKHTYPLKYTDIIRENAEKYNLDPLLVTSVIHAESRFIPGAVSVKDAKGLMQIREDTAEWCAKQLGITDFSADKIYEPGLNIAIGTWYLNYLLKEYDGNIQLCLAAYNAGMGNVDKWLNNPVLSSNGASLDKIPYPETERYIKKVMNNYAMYKMLY